MLVTGVEFFEAGKVYDFINTKNLILKAGDKVIVDTMRGRELARVVYVDKEIKDEGYTYKPIIALASAADLKKFESNRERAKKDFPFVQSLMKQCGIENKLCNIEFVLDGSKIIVSFVAEERVDFRELVKKLSEIYKIKVEIKLIGSRDELKIKGAIGPCGRECCCSTYMRDFEKISIKMAKNQNLSLSPTKISGACGKLMCCLAFENDEYIEMAKTMPKLNSIVKTKEGEGLVVYNDLFNQRCTIRIEKGENIFETFEFGVDEIEFDKK